MATNLGPQCSKQIFERKNIQNGNPRDNSDFPTTRGMGDIAGFQRRLFPHSNSHRVPEVSQVPFLKPILPVPGPPLWPINSSDGVHLCVQRGQVNGSVRGIRIHQYLDDWLIRAPTKESCHQGTYKSQSWSPNRLSSLWVTGTISHKDWSNRPRTVGS